MKLILIISASIILLSQFLLDFFIDFLVESKRIEEAKSKKNKIFIGLIILTLGLTAIWITFVLQKKDRTEEQRIHNQEIIDQKKRFDKLDSTNRSLSAELKLRNEDLSIIKLQNDSLRFQLFKLNEKQDEYLVVSKYSAQEVNKSRVAIENMGYKQVSRGISEIDKIKMINILKKNKGSKIKINAILGDSEALQFASQVKEVFLAAGWQTNGIAQSVYTNPMQGVYIEVKSENYPLIVNTIFDSFKVLNIIAKGNLNSKLNDKEVKILIGTK